ncbi:MAG: N-6 DNA methylase [Bacillota bacterium]
MLDINTKRRIDTARDILVGKVPDPKSQVEQITVALIYKFMDDMDAEAEELGGVRKFFAGEFARYGWARLMRSGLGGHETLNLYAEAIAKMPENPGIPPLFRDIFKNAYLPYRDPETLRAFLKIIDEFEYDHSERLGDAFEYLLSVLGSQGDAGQFRTPRHIIDFIVEVIDPKKHETVLDPACGTAGFLISSYRHILKANTDADGHSTLTPDERGRLAQNFKGYDISPDMVRLSLVNMYLHGFTDPHICEYDTLTSQERWNEYADVILANPPFMSPKGGIKPHNRFSVQSKRSEVLFVDYIAEHLTPNGRAGIIVPEGIIFQSQTAYKQLRKMLVEEYLVAVVSLPAGVFNPYSGVKTSILILDKSLAKQSATIAFFKIENDGYSLGAQRREIEKNDLPQVQAEIAEYLRRLRARESVEDFKPSLGRVVPKEKIAANGDYNLSGERYRENGAVTTRWPLVSLREVCTIETGSRQKGGAVESGVPSIGGEQIDENGGIRWDKMKYVTEEHFRSMPRGVLHYGDVLLVKDGATTGKTGFFASDEQAAVNEHVFILRANERVHPYFLFRVVRSPQFQESLRPYIKGIIGGISLEFADLAVPLPPLEVQKEIVAEIEGYQKVIDGARAVLDNYRPHIPIHPDWPMVAIGEVCELVNGRAFKPADWQRAESGGLPIVRIQNLNDRNAEFNYFTGDVSERHMIEPGELLFSWSGSRGTSFGAHIWSGPRAVLNQHIFKVRFSADRANKTFLLHALNWVVAEVEDNLHGGVGLVHITKGNLERIKIPLPPLATQRAIVAEIEAEQALVNANRELIARMEKKIQATLSRVWGEEEQNLTEV